MNKKQNLALSETIKFIDAIVNATSGNFSSEFGQPCMAEFAVSGIVNLQILQDAFPEAYKNALNNTEQTESELQTEFAFVSWHSLTLA